MSVKSTYNFVPAPKENEVFIPEWAEQVSHDIPFSDGESGEIELTITAKTPIFIRNGHTKADAENKTERYLEFSNIVRNGKKEYFIPATSIKGMLRNVLEIMSFSRMKQVSDDRYSFRDLSKSGNLYLSKYREFEIKAGWLIQDKDDNWKIEECENLAFIHHKELQKKNIPFRDLFLGKQPIQKTAEYKYGLVEKNKMTATFSTYTKELFGNVTRTMAKYDENGKNGTLVFTGQSSKRNEYIDRDGKPKANGKVHEFVFFNASEPNYLDVDEKMQKDFKFIYLDHDKQNISKDWKFWKKNLNNGEKVPVFYAKNNNELKHFGLAYMYKLPYEYSVSGLLKYDDKRKDLSEIIFGSIDKKDDTLKGRVFISHAFSKNAVSRNTVEKEILASPKASYFPYYLEQPKNKGKEFYNTYMDENAVLRGFKRYYINEDVQSGVYDAKQLKNEKVFTEFKPIKEGAIFKTKIRFHNLRKVEIGALLSAITFHGTENKSFHSVGAAKPFGYGKVSINDIKLNFLEEDKNDYLLEFEKLMGKEWLDSDIIKELFTIAQIPELSVYPKITEFVNYKKENTFLLKYSQLIENKKVKIESFLKKKEIEEKINDIQITNVSLNKIKEQIREELNYNQKELPDILKTIVVESISEAYSNNRETQRKLSKKNFDKEYEWKNTITTWLGKEKAKKLYKKLTGKDE